MKREKAILRQKLVEFQLEIAELKHTIRERENSCDSSEKDLMLNLLEIVDAFETLDENISAKEADLDNTSRALAGSARSIHKKLVRLLKSRNIVPLTFPENRAAMDRCKVVDTRTAPDQENETILTVVKNGWIDAKRDIVLRKADVITVLNE